MEASYSDAVSRKDLSGSSLKFLSAEMNGLSTSHCHAVGGRKDLLTTLHRTGICRWGSQHIVTKSHARLCRLCERAAVHPRRQPQERPARLWPTQQGLSQPTAPKTADQVNFIKSPAISSSPGTSQKQRIWENWIRVQFQILHVSLAGILARWHTTEGHSANWLHSVKQIVTY